ncbi:head GIN domain-containing protein, partial [Chloroflexota bacterium]
LLSAELEKLCFFDNTCHNTRQSEMSSKYRGLTMRKAIISIAVVTVLAAGALFSGCGTAGLGNIVTEEKEFADFTYVEIEGIFEVKIDQSDSFSTTVSADNNLSDYVTVSKEGDTLRICLSPRHTFTDFTLPIRTLKAVITMPELYGLNLSGASKGTITGFKSTHDFSLGVSGASSLNMKDMEVGHAVFDVSGASKVSGTMNCKDARFEVSGASKVELEGSADNIVLYVSGASRADLVDFPLEDADVNLSGASEATIHAKGRLDAILTAASRLYFLGNPTMGDIHVSGASTLKHK